MRKKLHFTAMGWIRIVVFVLACNSWQLAVAQQITGHVYDAETGQPLAAVNVSLAGTSIGAATSTSGEFHLSGFAAGEYEIIVSRIGYKVLRQEVRIRENQRLELNFRLTERPFAAPEVIVERDRLVGNPDRVYEIPGSAHFIDMRQLEELAYNDIHRVLQQIPGVNITEEDGYGLRPNIGLRGSGSERSQKITLMEDGVLIAPAPYSAPAAYYFPTVGRMQAVEVRKGSSQIKFGPQTTAGALNLISTSIPDAFTATGNFYVGSHAARRIHAYLGESRTHFGYLLETFQNKDDGFKELDSGGNTGFDKKDYMLKLRVNTSPTARIYQALDFKIGQTDEVSNETYLGLTQDDFAANPYRRYAASQNDRMKTKHTQYMLRHFIRWHENADLTTTLYRNEFSRNWYKLDKVQASVESSPAKIAAVLADPVNYAEEYALLTGASSPFMTPLQVKANNRSYFSRGIQSVLGVRYAALGGIHDLELGFRYHEDEIDRFQWVDKYSMSDGEMRLTEAGQPGTESNRIGRAKVYAGFVQQRILLGSFSLVPGIRYEHIRLSRDDYGKNDPARTGVNLKSRENIVSIFIPGVGADYKINQELSTFAGIHKGFSPPGSKEGTDPEESINYELGLRFNTASFALQAVAYFNDYQNLLGSDLTAAGGSGTGDQFNGGAAEVKGFELSMSYDLATALQRRQFTVPFRFTYSYTDASFKSDFASDFEPWGTVSRGDALPYVPRHQFTASLSVESKKYSVNASAAFTDRMRTRAGQGAIPDFESTDAHMVVDLGAAYTIYGNTKLMLIVRNLFDATYIAARRPAGLRPGLPRSVSLGLKTAL